MTEALERRTEKLAEDQISLTRNVDKLALMMEHSEKDRQADKNLIKDIAATLKNLDKRIDGMDTLSREVGEVGKGLAAVRHDVGNMQNTVVNGKLLERLVAAETLLTQYEAIKNRGVGAVKALGWAGRVFYVFVACGGLSGIYMFLHFFYGINLTLSKTTPPVSQIEREMTTDELDDPDSQ